MSLEATQAARGWENLFWSWLRLHANGVLELDGRAPVDVPLFVNAVNHVGIVHDHPIGVGPDGGFAPWPQGARASGSGLAPEPAELAEALHRVSEALPDHSLVVAGHGVNTDDEAWREHLLARSLDHVREAHHDIGLAGYFHDSGIDGYDWKLGFARPRGLLSRGRHARRPPTPSPTGRCEPGRVQPRLRNWARPPTASLLRRLARCSPSSTISHALATIAGELAASSSEMRASTGAFNAGTRSMRAT